MKRISVILFAAIWLAACGGTPTPVIKVDDLFAEREKSKAEFQKKYAGKEIVVAGVYRGGKRYYEPSSEPAYEEISINGSWAATVHCQNDGKGSAAFQKLPNEGDGVAVKGTLVSAEDDAYPALKPCSMEIKK